MKAAIFGRLAAAFAAVCMVCAAGGLPAACDNSDEVELPIVPVVVEYTKDGYKYIIRGDGTVKLTECILPDSDMLVIPAELDGKRVTELGYRFLGSGKRFKTVVFPVTLTKLSARTVYLSDVSEIVIPPVIGDIAEDAVYTSAMNAAYTEYIGGLQDGDTGEPEILGTNGIVKPVGDLLTVKCSEGSAAYGYAAAVGAKTVVLPEYRALAGDINCDGKLNNRDLKQLQRYITGGEEFFTPSFDVNGDGTVNNADLKRLQSFLTGKDVTVY